MMPNRRAVLGLVAAALWPGAAAAHTPYGQWVVYRQKHLLVGAHRGDGRTYALAQAVVGALDVQLPAARARIARGPRPERIASLMGTGQLLTAVLAAPEAQRMTIAAPPFDGHRPVPLQGLATLEAGYGLYAAPDLPADHAWLVARALGLALVGHEPAGLPPHPGAAAFWRGLPQPA